jgi:hypothetical protein
MLARNRNRNRGGPRGFVATLTPEGQINKIVVDMKNLKDGHDLHNWSFSARKELTPTLTVALQIGSDETARVYVPKLALVATSPVVRGYLLHNPTAFTAKFVHSDISRQAVEVIAQWLREISYQAEFAELPMPEDLKDFMKVRLTAYTLGIGLYTKHFDDCYAHGIEDRAPDLQEITTIVDNIRDGRDAILGALANQLSYLCRFHKVSEEREIAYANLLKEDKYDILLKAVDEQKVMAKAERLTLGSKRCFCAKGSDDGMKEACRNTE